MKEKSEYDYRDKGCPWCGGTVESRAERGSSMVFSTEDDYYPTCVKCGWNGHKTDSFDITW